VGNWSSRQSLEREQEKGVSGKSIAGKGVARTGVARKGVSRKSVARRSVSRKGVSRKTVSTDSLEGSYAITPNYVLLSSDGQGQFNDRVLRGALPLKRFFKKRSFLKRLFLKLFL